MLAHAVCPITAPSSSRTRCWAVVSSVCRARSPSFEARGSSRSIRRCSSCRRSCAARRRRLEGRSCAAVAMSVTSAASGGVVLGERRERVVEMSGEMCARAAHGVRRELLLGRAHQEGAAQLAAREAADQELALRPERDFAHGADCGRSRSGSAGAAASVTQSTGTSRRSATRGPLLHGGGARPVRQRSTSAPPSRPCPCLRACSGLHRQVLGGPETGSFQRSGPFASKAPAPAELTSSAGSVPSGISTTCSSSPRSSAIRDARIASAGAIGVQREERRAVGLGSP